jgi:predicted ATP-grasp superfamily ATP-dependent carboligase
MTRSFSVLILDGGDYGMLKILRCLGQAKQVTSHILSRDQRPLAKYSRYCRKYHYNQSHNDVEWIKLTKDLVAQYKIDILLPTTNESIEFTARNYDNLKEVALIPPTPNLEQLKITKDKWSFYCFVKEHSLPAPQTIFFADEEKITCEPGAFNSVEFPVLLKPTKEMGGRGIVKIDSFSDLYNVIEQKKTLQSGQQYVVQNYIAGEDLCLGAFCRRGKILSYVLQKDLLSLNNSYGHQKVMEYVHNDQAIEVGRRLISVLDWNGLAFIDFRIDKRDNSVKLLEVNPRLGRAFMGALSAGVNFPLNLCFSALDLNISDKQHESVRYAHPSAYLKLLMARIMRKPVPVKVSWLESGLRYSINDPLPEVFEAVRKLKKIRLFRSFFKRGRNKINGKYVQHESVSNL